MNYDAAILIVEDEVLIAEYIKDNLISLGFSQITLAHSKSEALHAMELDKPDLALLDIRMKHELDGIAIAETIAKTNKIPFIFITAHSDQDIVRKALATQPAAYLTKPFKKVDVFAAVSLALSQSTGQQQKFTFKDGYTTVTLSCEDILYIESEGNYISIVTEERKHIIRHSLEWCLQNLPPATFKRIHRSFIVNTAKIEKSSARSVYIGKKEIPKSRPKPNDAN
jgi:DNA-binding LytR/AlgR family response regulator